MALMPATLPLLTALLSASPAPLTHGQLNRSEQGFVLSGGAVDRLLVSPRDGESVVAFVGDRAFRRTGPARWQAAGNAAQYRTWLASPPRRSRRLPTGERIAPAALLRSGLVVGATAAGMVESRQDFRDNPQPVPLPTTRPVAAAANPKDGTQLLVAGTPEGLFVCAEPVGCQREQPGVFLSVAWFADGTRLAGDDRGGIWRFADQGWTRQQVSAHAIVDLHGVPDGGPRWARDDTQHWWLSQDHGLSWALQTDGPDGRLGSGGMLAQSGKAGALDIRELDGSVFRALAQGKVPSGAPVVWAGPDHVVVGLAGGVFAVERIARRARRLDYPDGAERPFLTAATANGRLLVYAVGPSGVVRFESSAKEGFNWERAWYDAQDASVWMLGVLALIVGLVLYVNAQFKRLARG